MNKVMREPRANTSTGGDPGTGAGQRQFCAELSHSLESDLSRVHDNINHWFYVIMMRPSLDQPTARRRDINLTLAM